MSIQSISDLFKAFQKLKVLVIGDVMIDAYIWGTVSRISPEAPVPVVLVEKEWEQLGLAANISNNLISLGVQNTLFSAVGDDHGAQRLVALLTYTGY